MTAVVYEEQQLHIQRGFTLTDSRIDIELRSASGTHTTGQASIPLESLRPEQERIRFRHILYGRGAKFAFAGCAVQVVSWVMFASGVPRLGALVVALAGLFLTGMGAWGMWHARQIQEAVRWRTAAGVIVLDVVLADEADREGFEAFVKAIAERVARASDPPS